MKRPSATRKTSAPARAKRDGLASLLTEVRDLIQSARRGVSTAVDTFQVMTNFEIGRRIVEHEQKGAKRAAYGDLILSGLSEALTSEFGRGFSTTNLKLMRQFFLLFRDKIGQTLSGESALPSIGQTKSDQLGISRQSAGKLLPGSIFQTTPGKSPFTLSWSHYVVLMTIKAPDERSFYEIEAAQANWDVRELKRQKATCLYERLALSRDKAGIRKLAQEGQHITRPEDLLKEPLVLEFLGLNETPATPRTTSSRPSSTAWSTSSSSSAKASSSRPAKSASPSMKTTTSWTSSSTTVSSAATSSLT